MKRYLKIFLISSLIMMIVLVADSLYEILYFDYKDPKVTIISAILSAMLGISAALKVRADLIELHSGEASESNGRSALPFGNIHRKHMILYIVLALLSSIVSMISVLYHFDYILLLFQIPITAVLTINLYRRL